MTPLDLTPIKDREAKASKGPWNTDHDDKFVATPVIDGDWDWITGEMEVPGDDYSAPETDEDIRGKNIRNNNIFIAHSRTDIPALIAEVERLRSILGEKA
jgi:hypothetical protein